MATIANILIFRREDLLRDRCDKTFDELIYYDFKSDSRETMLTMPVIMFIDDNGETKILKNRWGDEGNINPIKYKEMNFMNKNNAIIERNRIDEFINDVEKIQLLNNRSEKCFLELINQGLTIKFEPNMIEYYNSDGVLIILICLKRKLIIFDNNRFWKIFGWKISSFNYVQIKDELDRIAGKYLNCEGFSTCKIELLNNKINEFI